MESKPKSIFMLPWPLVLLTFFAALGGLLFGYDTGVVSGATVFLQDDKHLDLSDFEIELVVSMTVGFAAIGSLISGLPMQWYGRRPIILAACVSYTLGAACVGIAPNLAILLVGRAMLGWGVGLSSQSIPIYLAEVAPTEFRGMLVSSYNFFIVLGQAVACGVNIACTALSQDMRWRVSMGIAALPAIVMLLGFLTLPESPRWLSQNGKVEKAEGILRMLRGKHADMAQVEADLRDLQALPSDDIGDLKSIIKDIQTQPHLRRILLLGMGLMAFQQLSGINTIMYYGGSILEMCGFGESDSVALTALLAGAQGIGIMVSIPLFDRHGRRPLVLISTALVTVCLALVGTCFLVGIHHPLSKVGALVGMIGYLIFFGVGLSPGPWIINSEIYPISIRGVGSSLAIGTNWIFNFAISLTFLTVLRAFGAGPTFFGFGVVAFVGLYILWLFLPETANRSLEEIEQLFIKSDKNIYQPMLNGSARSSSGED